MLDLPGVTLCCIDTANHALALRALKLSAADIHFARVLLLTDRDLDESGVEVRLIPPIVSRGGYSQFVLKSLLPHIETPHVLLVQWDGYVVNPAAWRDEFLACDYLGGKWFWYDDGMRVGNGGFSLRSRKLLAALQDPRIVLVEEGEDHTIGRAFRPLLEREYGIVFGSEAMADAFSFEAAYPVGRPFGFHGLFNFCRVVAPDELAALVPTFSAAIARSPQLLQLGRNCVALGQSQPAMAIFRRILDEQPGHAEAAAALARAQASAVAAAGRNDPCPCGSGKRYKNCHGALSGAVTPAPAAASALPADPAALLREGRAAQRQRRFDVAKECFERVLALAPQYPEAWHLLGAIDLAQGRAADAAGKIERAIDLASDRAEFHRDLAHAQFELGRTQEAEASCRRAFALGLDDSATWALLGVILRKHDPEAAAAALLRAADLDPRNPDASFHLGNLDREQGRFEAAIIAYERALALAAGHPSVLNNLGLALEGAGEFERAQTAYRAVLRADPGHRQALGNLAHLLVRVRNDLEAASVCEEYLRRFPDAGAEVWVDLGICQRRAYDYDGAEASLARALSLAPDDPLVLTNLASLRFERGAYDQAVSMLARVVAQEPQRLYASTLLAFCHQHFCAWQGLDSLHACVLRQLDSEPEAGDWSITPLTALAMPMPAQMQLRIARRWARDLAPAGSSPPPPSPPAIAARRTRLRLGYISSDFRVHPTTSLLAEVWERHDRALFETFAYSIAPRDNSPLRARLEAAFDRFADCFDDSFEETAQRIRQDGIDILIDLNGYTQHARSEIFALRPAQVQVNWLGYLGTLGSEHIDYIITDRFVTPEDQQQFFTERFLYLSDCYCPSDTRREVALEAPARERLGLPPEGFVFCCFNNQYKILPHVFDIWMRLLARVPGSVLWLSPDDEIAAINLRREAMARGIDGRRLVFAPRVSSPDHLARHVRADLFLDTAPYNAGATANDALFMGLPVLTCSGSTMASRVAGSQLRAIGLPELVTFGPADYEALALRLACDADLLAVYRRRLAANRTASALFDMTRFTANLDRQLVAVWENRR